jgi:DUF438 domain-containing protein
MTDKKLQKLSRRELLEIMISQGEEIERLKAQLEEANKKLSGQEIAISESGSIAEAALKLNKIFEDADAAARQYLANVQKMADGEADSPAGEEKGK